MADPEVDESTERRLAAAAASSATAACTSASASSSATVSASRLATYSRNPTRSGARVDRCVRSS